MMLLKTKKQKLYLIRSNMRKFLLGMLCARYALIPAVHAVDLLESAFEPSKQNNQVVDL